MATPTPPGMLSGEMTRPYPGAFGPGVEQTHELAPATAAMGTRTEPCARPSDWRQRPWRYGLRGGGAGGQRSVDDDGHPRRKHLFGFAAIVVFLVAGLAAVAFFALRKSSFQQLQIGAQPTTEESRPADPSPAETPGEGAPAAATAENATPSPAPPPPPVAPTAPKPAADGTTAATAGSLATGRAGRGPTDGTIPCVLWYNCRPRAAARCLPTRPHLHRSRLRLRRHRARRSLR